MTSFTNNYYYGTQSKISLVIEIKNTSDLNFFGFFFFNILIIKEVSNRQPVTHTGKPWCHKESRRTDSSAPESRHCNHCWVSPESAELALVAQSCPHWRQESKGRGTKRTPPVWVVSLYGLAIISTQYFHFHLVCLNFIVCPCLVAKEDEKYGFVCFGFQAAMCLWLSLKWERKNGYWSG